MTGPDDARLRLIARLQQLPMRHPWLRWAVLAASLAFSAGSAYYFSIQVRHEAHSRFGTVAIGVANDVQSRIRAYGDVLYALRGLFDSSDKVTRDEFHRFAQALSLGERYPGVTNISFASRVPHAKKLEFERAVRAETSLLVKGLPEFAIKPPGERPEYAVLTYIEPMGKNIPAWGLDLNADPLRRSVIERARDTGQMASSSGVTLLRDGSASVSSTLLRLCRATRACLCGWRRLLQAAGAGGGSPASRTGGPPLWKKNRAERATTKNPAGFQTRHYVEEWFGLELRRAQRHGRAIAAIMLDVDHFKRFNDSFGHEAGDLVLRELAGALRRSTRRVHLARPDRSEGIPVLPRPNPLD